MFSRQAPQINHSLWQGGLSAAQASVIMNAVGQCRAPIVHRAPVTVDYTSPDMRLIDASTTNIKYPDIIIQPPEVPPPKPPTTPEEAPAPEPNPLPPKDPIGPIQPPVGAPGGGGSGPGVGVAAVVKLLAELNALRQEFEDYKANNPPYTHGDYIDVDGKTSRVISLKTESNSEGSICTFGVDEIKGKSLEDIITEDAYAQAFSYVKDIYLDGDTLKVDYGTAIAFEPTDSGTSDIPTSTCQP